MGPQKKVFISLPWLHCLPPSNFCLTFSLCHSLSHCHFSSPSLSLRLNGGVSSKSFQRELQAGHGVPEALKWGVDLKCVQLVFFMLQHTWNQKHKQIPLLLFLNSTRELRMHTYILEHYATLKWRLHKKHLQQQKSFGFEHTKFLKAEETLRVSIRNLL